MTHDQIEGIYYRVKRQDSDFIPMNSEEEARRFPTLKRKAKDRNHNLKRRQRLLKKKSFNLRHLQKNS